MVLANLVACGFTSLVAIGSVFPVVFGFCSCGRWVSSSNGSKGDSSWSASSKVSSSMQHLQQKHSPQLQPTHTQSGNALRLSVMPATRLLCNLTHTSNIAELYHLGGVLLAFLPVKAPPIPLPTLFTPEKRPCPTASTPCTTCVSGNYTTRSGILMLVRHDLPSAAPITAVPTPSPKPVLTEVAPSAIPDSTALPSPVVTPFPIPIQKKSK